MEKHDLQPVMFNDDGLNQQQRPKCAFNPARIFNPARSSRSLTAAPSPGAKVHRGQLRFPDLPRF